MQDERKYLIHPQFIILFLILAAISALFFGFTFAYLYSRIHQGIPPVKLPTLFYWNTLILLLSSATLWKAKKSYLEDDTQKYKIALSATLILTFLFLIAQISAWNQLSNSAVFLTSSPMSSYLYVISFVHFAHVIAGIPFLTYFILIAYKKMKSPVSVLLYFSDDDKKRKLDLLTIYWHFLDALWLYLVVFFLINYLIK